MRKIQLLAITLFIILMVSKCKYGKGNGGATFYTCLDCVSSQKLYVLVDDKKLDGYLRANTYSPDCDPDCDPKDKQSAGYVNYSGSEGVHTYKVQNDSGTVLEKGSFTIKKRSCKKIQLVPKGCSDKGKTLVHNPYAVVDLPSDYNNQGTITVKSPNIEICARDWDVVDGDVVTIIVNGTTLVSNVSMSETNKCWKINLGGGQNWIGVVCNSPGTTEAASPRIEVNDGQSVQGFNILSYPTQKGGYIIKVQI